MRAFGSNESDYGIYDFGVNRTVSAVHLSPTMVMFGASSIHWSDGGKSIAGDVLVISAEEGFRRTYDSNGHEVVQLENGATLLAVRGPDGATIDVGTGSYTTVYGNAGADNFDGSGATQSLVLEGRDGEDTLLGGSAGDVLFGGGGADILIGGDGNDNLYIDSDDLVSGTVNAGAGYDTLGVANHLAVTVILSQHNAERIISGGGDDTLAVGSLQSGEIYGGDGNDTITGGSGNDYLGGQSGNDTIHSGGDDDIALGGGGDDTVDGQEGADRLFGNEGTDTLLGGAGDDLLEGGMGGDHLDGGRRFGHRVLPNIRSGY